MQSGPITQYCPMLCRLWKGQVGGMRTMSKWRKIWQLTQRDHGDKASTSAEQWSNLLHFHTMLHYKMNFTVQKAKTAQKRFLCRVTIEQLILCWADSCTIWKVQKQKKVNNWTCDLPTLSSPGIDDGPLCNKALCIEIQNSLQYQNKCWYDHPRSFFHRQYLFFLNQQC